MKIAVLILTMTAWCTAATAAALSPASHAGPPLDLDIGYYTKVQTDEGVTREARYSETMMRRQGHIWVERILAKPAPGPHDAGKGDRHAATAGPASHVEFNHAVTPHHVLLENGKVRIEYVDERGRAVIAIPASEYANVNFDGSWNNAFFLIDPKLVEAMPLSARKSTVLDAQWHEREKNGMFERVLWDQKRQIPLTIESGDRAATFYRRVEVTVRPTLRTAMPWKNLSGYSQKEFSDYLD